MNNTITQLYQTYEVSKQHRQKKERQKKVKPWQWPDTKFRYWVFKNLYTYLRQYSEHLYSVTKMVKINEHVRDYNRMFKYTAPHIDERDKRKSSHGSGQTSNSDTGCSRTFTLTYNSALNICTV